MKTANNTNNAERDTLHLRVRSCTTCLHSPAVNCTSVTVGCTLASALALTSPLRGIRRSNERLQQWHCEPFGHVLRHIFVSGGASRGPAATSGRGQAEGGSRRILSAVRRRLPEDMQSGSEQAERITMQVACADKHWQRPSRATVHRIATKDNNKDRTEKTTSQQGSDGIASREAD
eukprot:2022085-Rhodomonas_salina.2